MSTTKLLIGVAVFIAVVVAIAWFQESRRLELVSPPPISLEVDAGTEEWLNQQVVNQIQQEELESPVTSATSEIEKPLMQNAQTPAELALTVSEETASTETIESVTKVTDQPLVIDHSADEREFLEATAAMLVYIQYGGKVGGKDVGNVLSLENNQKQTVVEGGLVQSLRVEEVSKEYLVLGYRNAPVLRKPRVDMEMESPRPEEMTSEMREKMKTRFDEIFGNRMKAASRKRMREEGIDYRVPTPEEQEEARQRYMETFGAFFEKVRSGDPNTNPRDYPTLDENFEANVMRYFQENWPGEEIEFAPADEQPEHATP